MIISKKMLIVFLQVPIDLDLQLLCGPLEEFLSIRKLYILYLAKWDTFSSSSACMNIECWDLAPLNQRLRLFDGTFFIFNIIHDETFCLSAPVNFPFFCSFA